jgi:cytochrome P450
LIKVRDILTKTTLDIIGKACLGVEIHSLASQNTPFSILYNRIFEQPPAGQLITAINIFIPCRSWLPFKANRDFLHATSEIRRLLLGMIKERTKELAKAEKTSSTTPKDADFLTLMLLERKSGINNWSDDDILGHLTNFMSAGHETSSVTLTWALHTLCLQPTIQARLRNEITARIPAHQQPTAADLESLHYMDLFVKEALRCFSPSVLVPRTPARPGVTICNTEIPVGTILLINPQAIHFNPTIWGPDVQFFNPDRHSPDHPSAKQYPKSRDPYALESFSNGPRICIGKSFALLEIKSVLVELLRRFEVERGWDEGGERLRNGEKFVGTGKEEDLFAGVKVQNFITLRPRDGAWIRFKTFGG